MNFLIFFAYYLLCTLFILSICILLYKCIFKRKLFNISKLAEKDIEKYFNSYDDDINDLLNDMNREDTNNDDTING